MPDIQILESKPLQVHLEKFANFSVFLLDSRGKAGLKAASTSLLESAVLAEAQLSHINKERKKKSFVKAKPKIACLKYSSPLFFSLHPSVGLT